MADTALPVIDVQMAFSERDATGAARSNPGAEDRIATLIAACRDAGVPVIHVHHISREAGSAFAAGKTGTMVQPCAAPIPGEAIYTKCVNAAFIGMTLEQDLRRDGISRLLICGATANHCVETTARMAGNLGFDAVLVRDAVWTYGATGPDGRVHSPEVVLSKTLCNLNGEFARITDVEQIVSDLG